MWKRWFFVSLSFNVVVLLTFLVFGFILPTISGKKNTNLLKNNPLTVQQQERMTQLNQKFNQMRRPLRLQRALHRRKIYMELQKAEIDTGKIFAICDTIRNGEVRLRDIQNHYFVEKNLLYNAAQRREASKLILDALERYIGKSK